MRRSGTGYGYSPEPYGYGYSQPDGGDAQAPQAGPAPASQWIAWAQSCLAKTVGSWVPQNGVMAKATRHAIRAFQQQQQLPATGTLNASTINALQAACSGQGLPNASPAPPQAPGQMPDPLAAGDDIPAGSAPDGPASDPSAGAPPDAPSGEFFMGGGGRRRRRRRWGSGFNFGQLTQPDSSDDDGEMRTGGGRGQFRRRWGSGTGYPQPPDDGGSGNPPPPPRRRW